jgi:D-3-phosphoglycerate dehydrogenase / 2-oxoglutarate reductase
LTATLLLTDAERFPFDDDDRLAIAAAGAELHELSGHDSDDVVAAARNAAAVFVYHARFPRDVVVRLDSVRVLARCGSGYDNIDVAAARERGIEVVYVPDYATEDVADHALALLLTCARKIGFSDRSIRDGAWPTYDGLAPLRRLRGRTLGIYGYGRIGRNLAAKALALGLRVLTYDTHGDDGVTDRATLFRESDFLSIHLPLDDTTHHLIGRDELDLMKSDAIVINTARGAILDTYALADALSDGRLGGAGIDVFEESPIAANHPLLSCDTAVLTPHAAAYTEEALAEVRKRTLADALGVLRGDPPTNPVPDQETI